MKVFFINLIIFYLKVLKLKFFIGFEVYLKTKIDKLAQLDNKNLDALKGLEIYSTKSIDDSRASVYFTPNDGNMSPEPLQTTPIHINYINDNFDAPYLLYCKRGVDKFHFDRKNQIFKSAMRPDRITGGCLKQIDCHEEYIKNKLHFNGIDDDNCCACLEEDDRDEYNLQSNIKDREKPSKLGFENEKLLFKNINSIDEISNFDEIDENRLKKKSKRFKNEYYYSLEDVGSSYGMKNSDIVINEKPILAIPSNSKSNTSEIMLNETGAHDLINGDKDLNNKDLHNKMQASYSLPEILNSSLHGKHVILAIENPENIEKLSNENDTCL